MVASSPLLMELQLPLLVLIAYATAVQFWRYRRAKCNSRAVMAAILKQEQQQQQGVSSDNDNDNNNSSSSKILEQYRRVMEDFSKLEFPLTYRLSLEFALFRTYTIPSISCLLEKTGRFQNNCGKRYDDTDLLLRELVENPFTSERSVTALRRINYIHGQFQGKISNEDMIYVLSVFILEPIRWINRFEWRNLTPEECDAIFYVWCDIGKRMGIVDFPDTLQKFDDWNQEFEKKKMVYASSNVAIAEATIKLFLGLAPSFLHPFCRKVLLCFMDARLRAALEYPVPNQVLKNILMGSLWLRKMLIRYLAPPRPRWLAQRRSPFVLGSSSSSSSAVGETLLLCPRFHIYEKTYQDGYRLTDLGDAPPGKLTPTDQCPFYSGKDQ